MDVQSLILVSNPILEHIQVKINGSVLPIALFVIKAVCEVAKGPYRLWHFLLRFFHIIEKDVRRVMRQVYIHIVKLTLFHPIHNKRRSTTQHRHSISHSCLLVWQIIIIEMRWVELAFGSWRIDQ